jgi:type IV pilus assembly protein PilF
MKMVREHGSRAPGFRYALMLVAVLTSVFFWGCAPAPVKVVKSTDIQTSSDEPDNRRRARIRLELALGYFNNGQTNIALDELKQSIQIDPNFFESHNLRGLLYMRLNDLNLAEESFQRALVLNPRAATVQHNYGWLLCRQRRYADSSRYFMMALDDPMYAERAKTWMALGLCQMEAGQQKNAEASLLRSFEMDPNNPIVAYNLALVFFQNAEYARSQFYLRRLNNSDFANAESLWLGVKVEHALKNPSAVVFMGDQLKKRFPHAKETISYERGALND